jgi:BirA family biotin operon repressor/biotin-[acetyl-CoA-carboxylase] ligase
VTDAFRPRLIRALDQEFREFGWPAIRCLWFPHLASTNQFALDLEPTSLPLEPVLVGCDDQQAGRGRRGRGWFSHPAHSLTFSLVFERRVHAEDSLAGLSLVIGLQLCEALASMVPGLSLKWPNDLLKAGRKCAGILVETRRFEQPGGSRIERVVCGIGLNLRPPEGLSPALSQTVSGLFDSDPPDLEGRAMLLAKVVRFQVQGWNRFISEGLAASLGAWERFDALRDQPIRVLADPQNPESELTRGTARGVAADGALWVETHQGMQKVYAGEVSVRPLALE